MLVSCLQLVNQLPLLLVPLILMTSVTLSPTMVHVSIFAPGVNILSALPDQESDYLSGTSMAGPHVAGVVARYQDSQAVTPSPEAVSIQ